jgi:ATP-dependent protease HslVU (ClpYQ) peptidase subunit
MSVIVAIKDNDRFVVGCDTRVSSNRLYFDNYGLCPKAFHINDNTIVACAGSTCLANIVGSYLKDMNVISRDTIISELLPKVSDELRGTPHIDNDYLDGELMIAHKNKCYIISSNYNVLDVQDYGVIGSGGITALSSLYTTEMLGYSPEARILIAIEVTGKIIPSVSQEVYMGDTKGDKFKKAIRKTNEKNR